MRVPRGSSETTSAASCECRGPRLDTDTLSAPRAPYKVVNPFKAVMHPYLRDTEFAVQNLFRLATDEENQIQIISENLKSKERELQGHQWHFQTSDLNEDFPDAYVMAAFARAGRAAHDVERLKRDVAALQASVGTRQHAVQALAGAILQIAKQGVSLVHGNLSVSPSGRSVGSLALRDVIWQSRNRSMHYETGKYRQPVLDLFSTRTRLSSGASNICHTKPWFKSAQKQRAMFIRRPMDISANWRHRGRVSSGPRVARDSLARKQVNLGEMLRPLVGS